MVRISEIKGDFYEFYEKDYAVVGRRTKKRLELGQKVQVKIRRTNMLKRNTDFTLLDY
jgi:ribonuclease R/exosome complex exonuclease DIS3/RRP44